LVPQLVLNRKPNATLAIPADGRQRGLNPKNCGIFRRWEGSMSDRVPSYRRHKQSGQAIVTLTDGLGHRKDVLLGKWESLDHYTGHRISCSMAGESPRERPDNKQTKVTSGRAR